MSDRNQDVRKLAEEIANECVSGADYEVDLARIAALLAELEAKVADDFEHLQKVAEGQIRRLQDQLHRALGEGAGLREALRRAADRIHVAYCMQEVGGDHAPACREIRTALASSPLSERAGKVLRAAERFRDAALTAGRNVLAGSDAELHSARVTLAEAHERLVDSVDALRTELAKGEEATDA